MTTDIRLMISGNLLSEVVNADNSRTLYHFQGFETPNVIVISVEEFNSNGSIYQGDLKRISVSELSTVSLVNKNGIVTEFEVVGLYPNRRSMKISFN